MHCAGTSLCGSPSPISGSRQQRSLARSTNGDHRLATKPRGSNVCRAEPSRASPEPAGNHQQPLTSLAPAVLSRRGLFRGLVAVGGLAAGAWTSTSSAQPSGPRALLAEEQQALSAVLNKLIDKSRAPGALRLVFHDSGTYSARDGLGGSNASIRFELDRPENKGLKRSWRWVEQAANELKGTAASSLSYADLIALFGAHAVALCGGPSIPVRVGRVDAGQADPPGRLPAEKFSAQELKDNFAAKGLTTQEFIVLSGAHTLGSKGFGDAMTFDNVYFKELLKKPWLNTQDPMASMIGLPSDHVLPDDPELVPIIQGYAAGEQAFFRDFSAAYVKMTELGATWR